MPPNPETEKVSGFCPGLLLYYIYEVIKTMEKIVKYFSDWWNMSAEDYGMLVSGKVGMIIVAVSLVLVITVCVSKKVRNLFF